MQILCLGLNHQTAPVELRERFAVAESAIGETAQRLAKVPGISEAVIVSTCNRVEYYVATEETATGLEALRAFVSEHQPWPDASHLYAHHTPATLRHLFRVVSGLDSMVLGETEILGQVKKAYAEAQAKGATARHLNKFFQRAFSVAKEVRTNTNITRGSVSVGSAAVNLAERIFGRLTHCKVMILGAGETSELTAGALQARGVQSIFVANRSYDRAVALADKMRGKAVKFDDWSQEFAEVDILIGSTAAPHHVVTFEKLSQLMRTRVDRPLFCIDLAVPRDFDPAVNDIKGVFLYDIDQLQTVAEASKAVRRNELAVCEEMIERHVAEFSAWLDTSDRQALAYSAIVSGGEPEGVRS
jgi:glutamyl-tRNA reductase